MPRHFGRQMKPPKRPTHLPRTAPSTDQISDLTVGGKPPMGDLLHNGPNALIEAWLNKRFITCHNCTVCLQTVDRPVLFMAKKSSTKKLNTTVLRSSKGSQIGNPSMFGRHYQGSLLEWDRI